MKKTYAEKLKDPRWQKKRLELLEAAQWECKSPDCATNEEHPTLHVHHKLYLRNTQPWEYEDWAYAVLCEACHERAQAQMEAAHRALAQIDSACVMLGNIASLGPEIAEVACYRIAYLLQSPETTKAFANVVDALANSVKFGYSQYEREERQAMALSPQS